MDSLERTIAREIVLAQIASDSGKGINKIHIYNDSCEHDSGYRTKEKHIINAINLIRSNPQNRFKFWIEEGDIANSTLVYFTFFGRRQIAQVSFHTFGDAIRMKRRKGRSTTWDEGSSREACYYLADVFKLSREP